MQSTNTQVDVGRATSRPQTAKSFRPQPFVAERVDKPRVAPTPAGNRARVDGRDSRFALAAAFRRLGRGFNAKAAYERAKDFYRSSGHNWARGLR